MPHTTWRQYVSLWSPLLLSLLYVGLSLAQAVTLDGNLHLLRFGTGGFAGTYFPLGSLLAEALSTAPLACQATADCPASGVLVAAQLSNGSVANVTGLSAGDLEMGMVQADVAYWAYSGTGIFRDKGQHMDLRAVANLYPESIHLVARSDSGIRGITDLRGKRVALDEAGSGTLVDARIILHAFGLSEADLTPVYLKAQYAAPMIVNDTLDALFLVAGYPSKAVAALLQNQQVALVPIMGPAVETIVQAHPYFTRAIIPAGSYVSNRDTPTLAVGAQLYVPADLDTELVYELTQALWHADTLRALQAHPKGWEVQREHALEGLGAPLHPGAQRYYQEVGLWSETSRPQVSP